MRSHQVSGTDRYPDGLKWGLVCVDRVSGRKVLMDNHHLKGPHIHIDDTELPYDFIDLVRLVEDFRQLITETMGVQI